MRPLLLSICAITAIHCAQAVRAADTPAKDANDKTPQIKVKIVEGGESKVKAEDCRGVIIGPGVNQPDPFPGYRGFVGWACPFILKDGTWWMGFSPGYWHASAPTPLAKRYRPEELADYIRMGLPADIDAPTGGRLMITQSKDQGKTWGKPTTLLDTPSDDRHPTFFQLDNGVILCSFFTYEGTILETNLPAAKVVITRSLDNGRTWEEPKRPAPPFVWEEIETRMIQLQDGSLVLAMTGQTEADWKQMLSKMAESGKSEWDLSTQQLAVLRSTDDGVTWKTLALISAGHELSETSIAQLPSGRLVCISRGDGDVCFSDDGGHTWTKPVSFGMRMFATNLYVLHDGALLCLHGSYGGGGLRALLSTDGGETWIAPNEKYGFLVDKVYGYGAAVPLGDDTFFLAYQGPGGHSAEDAKNMSIYGVKLKVRADRSGIDLLPAPNAPTPQTPAAVESKKAASPPEVPSGKKLGTIFNNDINNILLQAGLRGGKVADYQHYLDQLLAMKPRVLAQNVGLPDPVIYRSDVATTLDKYIVEISKITWPENVAEKDCIPQEQCLRNLYAAGTDALQLTVDACRREGVLVVASYRMNAEDWYQYTWQLSDFGREHPDYRIPAQKDSPHWATPLTGNLDPAIPAVYEHRMKMFREVVDKYDIDGIEFDFRRWYHMVSDPEKNHVVLTRMVRDTRAMLDEAARRKGRNRLLLGVRVAPSLEREGNVFVYPAAFHPEEPYLEGSCRYYGLDVPTWVKEGLVDYICPSQFLGQLPCMPFTREFTDLTKGTEIGVYPTLWPLTAWMHDILGVERDIGFEPKDRQALALYKYDFCTTALQMYADGADGISTFNWYAHLADPDLPWPNGGPGATAVQKYALPFLGDPAAIRNYLDQPWAIPPQ